MATFSRSTTVDWTGSIMEGTGTAKAGTGAFTLPVSFPKRIGEAGGVGEFFGGFGEAFIGPGADDAGAEDEGFDFFFGEHEWWQVEPASERVPNARLPGDRDTRSDQVGDIAVDGPFRDLELRGDVGGGEDVPAPQELDDLEEAVGSAHG